MSNDNDKIKHSQRRHKIWRAIKHQLDIAKAYGVPVKNAHQLAKKHALNCGNARCMLCGNPRRIWKEKTMQEKRSEQDLGE